MDPHLEALESALRSLTQRVEALESKVGLPAPPPVIATEAPSQAEPHGHVEVEPISPSDLVSNLPLAGRSLIILGGAYLIRALTEGGTVPLSAGVGLGLVYALVWFLAAGRARQRTDAHFHSLVGTLIGFPLVVEATAKFHLLEAPESASVLGILALVVLGIAWRAGNHVLAWLATLGTLGATLVLIATTGQMLPFAVGLLVLGQVTLWLAYSRDWNQLRWPVALLLDLVGVGVVVRALANEHPDPPGLAIALLLAMVGAYLVSIALRTLVRGRNVNAFEIVQTALGLVVGLGGAALVAVDRHSGTLVFGLVSSLLGAGSYAVAYAFVDSHQGHGRNFVFYTILALIFLLTGANLLMGGTALALFCALLAVASAYLGGHFGRVALLHHSVAYLLVAGLASGMLGSALQAFLGTAAATGTVPTLVQLGVLGASLGCALTPLPRQGQNPSGWVAHTGQLVVAFWGAGGVAIHLTLWILTRSIGPLDSGAMATVATVTLSLSAIVLAYLARRAPEARWVAWTLLGATGLKLLIQDLGRTRPVLLMVSFAVYGAATILVPQRLKPGQKI